MPDYEIRPLLAADLPGIMLLQQRYVQACPGVEIIPGEVYYGPGFSGGRNVFSACLPDGRIAGYAPLYPVPAAGDAPHVIWATIRVDPELPDEDAVRELLLAAMLARAQEIARDAPGHPCRLTFDYLQTETSSIAYVLARGARYSESVFGMCRDLEQPLPDIPQPAGITVRSWRMPTEAEQIRYVEARNEAFPGAPISLAEWQYFLQSRQWAAGTAIAAFEGDELVGSVIVFWDEDNNRRTGRLAGLTEYIFVRSAWRGRGIARHMVGAGLAYLREHGLAEANLTVRARNATALDLYWSLGYEVAQETQLYVLVVPQ